MKSKKTTSNKRWPIIFFVVLSPVVSSTFIWWLDRLGSADALKDLAAGIVAGQVAFAVVLGSWFGRTWLHSYTLGCCYLITNFLIHYLTLSPFDLPRQAWLLIFFIPSYLLAASAVPLVFRLHRRWVFVDRSFPSTGSSGMGIEGIMTITTMIASNFVLLKSASELDASFAQANIYRHLILLSVATAVGTVLIIPFGFVALRIAYLSGQLVLLIAYGLSLYILLESMLAGFSGRAGQLGASIFVAVSAYVATLFFGARCFLWSGYGFAGDDQENCNQQNEHEAEERFASSHQKRMLIQQRVLLAAWLAATLGVSLFASFTKS